MTQERTYGSNLLLTTNERATVARAYRCRRFREVAAYGKNHLTRYAPDLLWFPRPCALAWLGIITWICLAPANVSERAAVPELAAHGLVLLAPLRWVGRDPHPGVATRLARLRYLSTRRLANSSSAVTSSASGLATDGIYLVACSGRF